MNCSNWLQFHKQESVPYNFTCLKTHYFSSPNLDMCLKYKYFYQGTCMVFIFIIYRFAVLLDEWNIYRVVLDPTKYTLLSANCIYVNKLFEREIADCNTCEIRLPIIK